MKHTCKSILALFFAFVISLSFVAPAHAADGPGVFSGKLWDWVGDYATGSWWRDLFGTSPDDPSTAYNAYTKKVKDKLGTTAIGSKGFYIYASGQPSPSSFDAQSCTLMNYQAGPPTILSWASGNDRQGAHYLYNAYSSPPVSFAAPVSGYYTFSPLYHLENAVFDYESSGVDGDRIAVVAGSIVKGVTVRVLDTARNSFCSVTYYFRWFVEPYTYAPNDFTAEVGGAASRPSSLIGNLGYYGDDGKLVVAENAKLVDETNNTVYNPVTNTTSNVTNWNYDYSDRSYNLTLEGDKTSTVTYGDEYVTIKEGDTIYNIYYVTQPPDPSACQHTYTDTITTAPTCTIAGVKTSTCSKCNASTTASVPALGHKWAVERTVQTTYDDAGALVQKGYTIYKCSTCNEQYKDENSTGPPGGGGSGGSGSESDKDSFWGTLGKKLGNILGGIGDFFVAAFEMTVGKLLDAVQALVDTVKEKALSVIETIMGLFDSIPSLFSGFTGFLAAVFPFLPPEISTLLIFGVALSVLLLIIKAVLGRR